MAQTEQTVYQKRPVQWPKKEPIITFVADDGNIGDWDKLRPLSITYDVPFVSAIITGKDLGINKDYEKLRYLQNDLKWEIASHTVTHRNIGDISESEKEYELKTSKETLQANGLNVRGLVYPFGGAGPDGRRIASKYFDYSVSIGSVMGPNTGVIPSHDIKRVALGSWFDNAVVGLPATDSLEYYKARVDQCIAETGWLVFMLHPTDVSHNATQQAHLEAVIQYIKSKNVKIATLSDGYDVFGNLWESGEFIKNTTSMMALSGHAMNKFGESMHSNIVLDSAPSGSIDNTTPLTAFKKHAYQVIAFTASGSRGFPTTAGSLLTYYCLEDPYQSWQMWYEYGGGSAMFRRRWMNDEWFAWERFVTESYYNENMFHKTAARNAYTNDSPISSYPNNSITTCYINSAGASGFPGIGILTTYNIGENGVYRQEFRKYNSNQIYSRYVNTSGAWTEWVKISAV
ncbi:polysaccharide deacetylase family protein [Fundicoccus sp. Sow4_D5]|uniref:polysaccharide deacetylase family protein n=1 Tax=Fundicoccus sp. Sow4_D5 TaxID=3438782 RepID=UPI003F8F5F82